MSGDGYIVETTSERLGWPVAGDLVHDAGGARVPINFGTRALWSNNSGWLRALQLAAGAGANVLDAINHTTPAWSEAELLLITQTLYCVLAAEMLPQDEPDRDARLDRALGKAMTVLGGLTDEQRADLGASWLRDRVDAERVERAAHLVDAEQAPAEPLGLRDAALGRPSVGTRPLAQQPEGEAR